MSAETPGAKPTLEEVLMQSNALPWRPKSLQGVSEKMLWRDEATGASIALIKFDKGCGIPAAHLPHLNQRTYGVQVGGRRVVALDCFLGNHDKAAVAVDRGIQRLDGAGTADSEVYDRSGEDYYILEG